LPEAFDPDGLRDDQWERLAPLVPGGAKGRRGPRSNNRRFLDALLWMARSGARWRDLPPRLGPYQTVKRRYYRWVENGVIERIFHSLAEEADFEWLQVDATIVRAHKHAAGAPLKRGALHPRDWVVQKADTPPSCTP
jgi:transposase